VPETADEVISQHECFRGRPSYGMPASASEKFGVFRQNASPPVLPRPAQRFAPFQQLTFDAVPG
jgi:hypothetical protein